MVFVIIACILDIRTSKVSNQLIFLGYISSLYFQVRQAGWNGIKIWGMGAVMPMILLFLLFYFKMLGAGDIKLFSVIGSFYGTKNTLFIILFAFLVGAVYSIISLLKHHSFKERFRYFFTYLNQVLVLKKRIPYISQNEKTKTYVIHFTVCILIGFLGAKYLGYLC